MSTRTAPAPLLMETALSTPAPPPTEPGEPRPVARLRSMAIAAVLSGSAAVTIAVLGVMALSR